jgi:hypothetical protein
LIWEPASIIITSLVYAICGKRENPHITVILYIVILMEEKETDVPNNENLNALWENDS